MERFESAQETFENIIRLFKDDPKTSYARTALKYFCKSPLAALDCETHQSSNTAYEIVSVVDKIYIEDITAAEVALRDLEKVHPNNLDVLALNSSLYLQKKILQQLIKIISTS